MDTRVSDEDRERAAQAIREHYASGRLSEDELSARVQAAYSARTAGELQALLADLPPLPPSPSRRRAEIAQRRRDLQRRVIQQSGAGLVAFVICTLIWLASGAHGQFWPVWVALVAVIPLVRNGWRLYGPAPEFDRVEEELTQRSDRPRRRRM